MEDFDLDGKPELFQNLGGNPKFYLNLGGMCWKTSFKFSVSLIDLKSNNYAKKHF